MRRISISNPSADFAIGSADDSDRIAALSLVFSHLPPQERARRVAELTVAARQNADLLSRLLVARRGGRLVAAIWGQEMPGNIAILWGPQPATQEAETARAQLLDHLIKRLLGRKIRIVQALPNSPSQSAFLAQHGFETRVQLSYLAYPVTGHEIDVVAAEATAEVQFDEYHPMLRSQLQSIIEATYAETLDAPQLNGMRETGDILDGYFDASNGDASRWWIVKSAGKNVGCLLLADHPTADNIELVYMGLILTARGRGWGCCLVRRAQVEAAKAGRSQLVLAVDARNDPAIQIYSALGFQPFREQEVRLKFLEP